MQETKELNALFTLIDDPDEEVYSTVSEKIVEYGKPIIPNLEYLWETTPNEDIQQRIENIIHRLHFSDLLADFKEWSDSQDQDLLFGALLASKFQYPELSTAPVIQEIEKIKRTVWLELNSFLTPLEQANVLSSIVYNYYQLTGISVSYSNPDAFLIHKVLECKKGNTLINGIIYQILCEKLDINARIINIPKQCMIAFYQSDFIDPESDEAQDNIHFYIDATNGQAYAKKDIEQYLNKSGLEIRSDYFKPVSTKKIIQLLLQEIAKCFEKPEEQYKKAELMQLKKIMD